MSQVRLDRFLANAGLGTRSQVKELLRAGLVEVNGARAKRPEEKIDPDRDRIFCRGEEIFREESVCYMLNKPAGFLSATEDRYQPVVLDLLEEKERKGLFPVGRLDIDTEGLLLLTNDGALAHGLLSPRHHVDKTYRARVAGLVNEEDCRLFADGLDIGEKKPTMPALLRVLSVTEGETGPISETEITIQEGKFHQVKRMFAAVGKQVIYLKRTAMGGLLLDETLQKGEYRELTREETERLRQYAGK